jgi:3-oxoacyl-[acyl-carrier protein] reductase
VSKDLLGGRHAMVTGGGQGVGRAIALRLAADGAGTIVVNDLFADRAEAVAEEVRRNGGQALALAADVTDLAAVTLLAEKARSELDGPVQIVVNNAGLPPGQFDLRPFVDTEPAAWEPLIRLNLYGVLHVTHAFLRPMLDAGWGRVVTIVSDAARAGDPRQAVYAAAKAGAAGFMRSLASEVGRAGVTANCISLASIRADIERGQPVDEEVARHYRGYAIRRPGHPDDIAPLVSYLSSDDASWVTGQTYGVNGGYTFGL